MTPRRADEILDQHDEEEEGIDGDRLVRFARLSWNMAAMSKKLEEISAKVDRVESKVDNNREEARRQLDDLASKYATKEDLRSYDERNKPTRDALNRINWIIITAVVGALLALVIANRGGLL